MRSGWKKLKRAGLSLLTGKDYSAAQRVISYLSSIGIFVVPVGELERWFPDVEASHGEGFVTTVLEDRRLKQMPPDLEKFVVSVIQYFGITLDTDTREITNPH